MSVWPRSLHGGRQRYAGDRARLLLTEKVRAPASNSREQCWHTAEGAHVMDIVGMIIITGYSLVLIGHLIQTSFH